MSESKFVLGQKVFYAGTDHKVYPGIIRKIYSDGFLSLDYKGCAMVVPPAQVFTEADKLVVNSLFSASPEPEPEPKFKVGDRVTLSWSNGAGDVAGIHYNGRGDRIYDVTRPSGKLVYAKEWEMTLVPALNEPKFKVGDRVRTNYLANNSFGTISQVYAKNRKLMPIYSLLLDNGDRLHVAREVELSLVASPEPKFKVGDRVTVNIPQAGIHNEGVIFEVTRGASENELSLYRVRIAGSLLVYAACESELTLLPAMPVKSKPKFKVNDYVQTVNPRSRFFGRELRVAVVRDGETRALCADGGAWFNPDELRLSPDNGDTVTVTTRELVERCYDILSYLAAR